MAKGQMYVTMTEQEKMAFLGLSGKESYKMKGHSFAMMKYGGKQYCKSCGFPLYLTGTSDYRFPPNSKWWFTLCTGVVILLIEVLFLSCNNLRIL